MLSDMVLSHNDPFSPFLWWRRLSVDGAVESGPVSVIQVLLLYRLLLPLQVADQKKPTFCI